MTVSTISTYTLDVELGKGRLQLGLETSDDDAAANYAAAVATSAVTRGKCVSPTSTFSTSSSSSLHSLFLPFSLFSCLVFLSSFFFLMLSAHAVSPLH